MKFFLDERVKHRSIGIVVLVAIAVIFLPALMKESNYHFDEKVNVSVKLPEKPPLPKVAIPTQKAMFNTVQVAHVNLPKLKEPSKIRPDVKALSMSAAPNLANARLVVKTAVTQVAASNARFATLSNQQPPLKKDGYSIQLASFSKQKNAELLVTQLKKKGYKAKYMKSDKQGDMLYKVIVGEVAFKDEAKNLQKQLAETIKLHGLIVKTGVS